ncbi:MAG: UvrD-helicase domain-containing protein [Eggerthellaceae bacterium]|nr:UvrD-helicase domain-containing protein [Eggerthellaceae bacterium]
MGRESDPIFVAERDHLVETHAKLRKLEEALVAKMERTRAQAAADKESMAGEVSIDLSTDDDAMETYADFLAMNSIISNYNIMQEADTEKLGQIHLLLRQPYFAKVALRFKPNEAPREFYIGNAGMSDEMCRRMVVDWRSPIAETYYSQDNGMTSYKADGRVIKAELTLRRQFDIEEDRLNGYFDTTVAIQDSLLLASLSRRRTSQMQAITATIQREQNLVVRHEDVPVLLVSGIAGSGKTSVLMQRIAYLFYQQRGTLDPREVYLITPNPLFGRYIDGVLPDMGERNPEILTYDAFMRRLLPQGMGPGQAGVSMESLAAIDKACASFEFDSDDFRDIECAGERLIPASQIRKIDNKFRNIPAGPHRVTLIREELERRLASRLKQLASTESAYEEMFGLTIEEQLRLFGEVIDPQTEAEERALALKFLETRYADSFRMVEEDEWLRVDRIGGRLLGNPSMTSVEWLYLRMALTGLCDRSAKYVMIDEVQDYTAAQLAIMARFFRKAHFLLLGDPNQSITEGTASFAEIKNVFEASHGSVELCQLMTSYRSSPEITTLFARLAGGEEQMLISSVQREGAAPEVLEFTDARQHEVALRAAVSRMVGEADAEAGADAHGGYGRMGERGAGAGEGASAGLTAIVAPYTQAAKKIAAQLADTGAVLLDDASSLPESGVVVVPLKLAKGLEFDRVIIPDASERVFPAGEDVARRRLYTSISRATHEVVVLSNGPLTSLLAE